MKTIITSLLLLLATPAFAQSAPPVDPEVAVYRQLLDGAQAHLASTVKQADAKIQALQKQVADLQKQLASAKQPEPHKPNPEAH